VATALLAASTPGSVALGGVTFLVLGIAGALVARLWFSHVASHPPREGTAAHRLWQADRRYLGLYRLVTWLVAIGSLGGGIGMLVFATYRAVTT